MLALIKSSLYQKENLLVARPRNTNKADTRGKKKNDKWKEVAINIGYG